MSELIDLFSSRAQSRVLQTLSLQFDSIPLRQLAELSDVPLFSVQRVAQNLINLNVIIESRENNLRLFKLNPRSEYHDCFRSLFKKMTEFKIKKNATRYKKKPQKALEFSQSAHDLIQNAKRSKP